MQRNLVLALAIPLLGGCAIDPASLQAQSSMDLCVDYLTLPRMGANFAARTQELSRRNENCSGYQAEAQAKRDRDARQKEIDDRMRSASGA
jgi:hypothetical protein